MLGLQPLLLGALADEHRLDVDAIGLAATAELLALGLTTGLLAGFVRPRRLRLANVAGALCLALANAAGLATHGAALIASRAAAGIAAGVLVWIAVSLITRAARPDRLAGIFLTVQTLAQAALAALLPISLMPAYGANAGFAALALLAFGAAGLAIWLPSSLQDLPKPATAAGLPPRASLLGLAAMFCSMAGIVGLWVFVEQLGATPEIGTRVAGLAVAAALAAQVAGSATATLLSGRLPALAMLIGIGVADIAVVQVLGTRLHAGLYLACVLLFGFLWLFSMPFQTRLLIDLDPSRRAAMLLSAAQLLGSAAGPVITASFATAGSLHGALVADTALFAVGVLVFAAVGAVRKQSLPF